MSETPVGGQIEQPREEPRRPRRGVTSPSTDQPKPQTPAPVEEKDAGSRRSPAQYDEDNALPAQYEF